MPRSRGRGRLVTLTSDVGAPYAAQMKAVLLRSLSPDRLVDLAHDLPAHAVGEAAFVVRAMALGFPPGTVHVVVVDPGVGGRRAPIVIACREGSVLVGPDNGVLYPLAEALGLGPTYRLRPTSPRARVGTTFDGRDLFAPAAARLARGVPAARLGPPHRPRAFRLPVARRSARGATGEVLHVDHFGNLITNVPSAWVPAGTRRASVAVGRSSDRSLPWALSYEAIGAGRLGLLGSSFGTVEMSVAQGRADRRLGARVGVPVRLTWAVRGRVTVNSVRPRRVRVGGR